jgi:hypothetical protein
MDAEVPTGRVFRPMVFWIVLGIALEFLLIPKHPGTNAAGNGIRLFMSGDFYYALLSPIVVWWFFRRLIPAKERELGTNGVRLLNFIFGIYIASALRAVLAAFFAIHVGVWG